MFESVDNVLFNTLLGVKYIVSENSQSSFYQKKDGYRYIYENSYAYPIGYASDRFLNIEDFNKLTYPYNISYLLSSIINNEETNYEENVIEKASLKIKDLFESKDNRYILDLKEDTTYNLKKDFLKNKTIFIVMEDIKNSEDDISITINGIKNTLTNKWLYYNNNETFTFVISDIKDDLEIEIEKGYYDIGDIKVYCMDNDIIKDNYNYIDKMNITYMKNNKLIGNISVRQKSYFVATIAYDKGFSVYVNGT